MPQPDFSWHPAFLEALRRAGSREEAAAAAGVPLGTVDRHLRKDRAFYDAAQRAAGEYRAEAGLPPVRDWKENAAARERILVFLAEGGDFKASAARAGVPLPTARRWRRLYPDWDRRALDAAAAGGGTVLSPSGLRCPGSHCGTATGYDYGCRAETCTSAKSRQVTEGRKRAAAPEGTARPAVRIGLTGFRAVIGQRVSAACLRGEPTVLEKNGEPCAVLVPYGDWVAMRALGGTERRPPPIGLARALAPFPIGAAVDDADLLAYARLGLPGLAALEFRLNMERLVTAEGETAEPVAELRERTARSFSAGQGERP